MLRIAQSIAGLYLIVAVVVTVITLAQGPLLGGAPLGGILDGAVGREPVTISIAYGSEKDAWLKAAAAEFAATNPRVQGRPIEVRLEPVGSREIVTRIVQGNLRPTVASPASSVQTELLRSEWQARTNTDIYHSGGDAPQPLVLTPLVVVAWEERASMLGINDPNQLWDAIHRLVVSDQGWAQIGRPQWGLGKFGQTDPSTSNSGIQTLVLLAYHYHNKTSGLQVQDVLNPSFQAWLDEFQRAVLEFPSSTGFLMQDVVRFGPSKYDFVTVYENLAIDSIETAANRWGPTKIYYPANNILSDHPYAILNAPWVSAEQRQAAAQFRTFLLSREMQELALTRYGFRPANSQVSLDISGSPFERYASYGLRRDISAIVETPAGDVSRELITFWERQNYR